MKRVPWRPGLPGPVLVTLAQVGSGARLCSVAFLLLTSGVSGKFQVKQEVSLTYLTKHDLNKQQEGTMGNNLHGKAAPERPLVEDAPTLG